MRLSKHQRAIMDEMSYRAVIGEFAGKFNSSFELFSLRNKAIMNIKRATFFVLLEKGCIELADKQIIEAGIWAVFHEPFGRDNWYRATAKALREFHKDNSK